MKENDKVKALVGDKYLPGIVKQVEDKKGFRGTYPYQNVWVEFLDHPEAQYRSYDLIPVEDKPKKEKKNDE